MDGWIMFVCLFIVIHILNYLLYYVFVIDLKYNASLSLACPVLGSIDYP